MSATLKDIARETGLSVATVSKYINGATLKEKNRVAIERAVKKLGYTVNEYARGLKSSKSRTIGVVIPELSNLFITQIITQMEEILRSNGYSIIICDCHTDETLECEAIRFLMGKMVDGMINMPVCRDGRHLRPALTKNIPVVLIDRTIPELSSNVDCVLIDNVSAAERATQHLLDYGHRRIGVILGPQEIFTTQQRLKGYQAALAAYKLSPADELVVYSDYTLKGGHESMRCLLDNAVDMTAVFVTNYEMTLGAIIAAKERSVLIPKELSFIGFDNMDLSRIAQPKLSIVTQPLGAIGTHAARMMLERLQGQSMNVSASVVLSAELMHGDSVAKL